jgi:hypothetical protein
VRNCCGMIFAGLLAEIVFFIACSWPFCCCQLNRLIEFLPFARACIITGILSDE